MDVIENKRLIFVLFERKKTITMKSLRCSFTPISNRLEKSTIESLLLRRRSFFPFTNDNCWRFVPINEERTRKEWRLVFLIIHDAMYTDTNQLQCNTVSLLLFFLFVCFSRRDFSPSFLLSSFLSFALSLSSRVLYHSFIHSFVIVTNVSFVKRERERKRETQQKHQRTRQNGEKPFSSIRIRSLHRHVIPRQIQPLLEERGKKDECVDEVSLTSKMLRRSAVWS